LSDFFRGEFFVNSGKVKLLCYINNIDTLSKNSEFVECLKYLNAQENEQQKGTGGGIR
jgi:hypothetical protein